MSMLSGLCVSCLISTSMPALFDVLRHGSLLHLDKFTDMWHEMQLDLQQLYFQPTEYLGNKLYSTSLTDYRCWQLMRRTCWQAAPFLANPADGDCQSTKTLETSFKKEHGFSCQQKSSACSKLHKKKTETKKTTWKSGLAVKNLQPQ